MPWTMDDHPQSLKNLDELERKKAIDIANNRDIEPALAAFHLKTIIPKINTNIGMLAMSISIVVVLEIKLKTPPRGKKI